MSHKFYVSDGLNRNFILGRDWLQANGVRLYFDLGCMRIGNTYVSLENDIHVNSLVRTAKKTVLKPQTATVCEVKLSGGFPRKEMELVEIKPMSDCLKEDPGLTLQDSITEIKGRRLPVMIVNNTNKTQKIPAGHIIGQINKLARDEVKSIQEVSNTEQEDTTSRDIN